MDAITWFVPLITDIVAKMAPVAFVIFCVTFAMDFILDAAYGRRRGL